MLRPATPLDRSDVIALLLAEDAAWSGAGEVSAQEAGELLDQFEHGAVFERDECVAGYAGVGEGGATLLVTDPVVDPVPALEALADWLGERGHHELDAYADDARRIAWMEGRGLAHRRSSFDLQRGIDPPPEPAIWPSGVEVAPFRPGEDDEAVHALMYVDAAWAEVPGHSERSLESWRVSVTPEHRGWVARRDGRPVGWVLGRVFDDGRGWIAQLAVAEEARRAGLGRALLLHALHDLQALGATSFALGVQGENESAIALYRAVGFEIAREWRVYGRPGE